MEAGIIREGRKEGRKEGRGGIIIKIKIKINSFFQI
jgi:hypothetical protein